MSKEVEDFFGGVLFDFVEKLSKVEFLFCGDDVWFWPDEYGFYDEFSGLAHGRACTDLD